MLTKLCGVFVPFLLAPPALAATDAPVVEIEEVVATALPADNGAGPLWCYGAPLLVRRGNSVYVSALETGEGIPPLCNTRWRLLHRASEGWRPVAVADDFREREPCPVALTSPDGLLLSVNPSTQPRGTKYGPCDPHWLLFDATVHDQLPRALRAPWPVESRFTDHSYRGLAADPSCSEFLALHIDASTSEQRWSLLSAEGRGLASGSITFPIRSCYPQVALRNGSAHVLAIGDIVEPERAWREHKKQATGSAWDYVFRRLFYAFTPDLRSGEFSDPIEIDSVEATGGRIVNLDLWLAPDGTAHVLYLASSTTPILRDRFFPDLLVVSKLEHVELRSGQVTRRRTLHTGGEQARETVSFARFHSTPDGRLFAVVSLASASSSRENRLIPLTDQGRGEHVRLDLAHPFQMFFTATERGGSAPSTTLDLYGSGDAPNDLRYARVKLP